MMLSAEWNAFVLFFNKMTRVVCAIFIGFVTGIIPFHGLLCATFIRFVTRTIPSHGLLILQADAVSSHLLEMPADAGAN